MFGAASAGSSSAGPLVCNLELLLLFSFEAQLEVSFELFGGKPALFSREIEAKNYELDLRVTTCAEVLTHYEKNYSAGIPLKLCSFLRVYLKT